MKTCPSGKQRFDSEQLAVDALLDLWSRVDFGLGTAPVTVYLCTDCGDYHFTSRGEKHPRLEELIRSGTLGSKRRASEWERKFR